MSLKLHNDKVSNHKNKLINREHIAESFCNMNLVDPLYYGSFWYIGSRCISIFLNILFFIQTYAFAFLYKNYQQDDHQFDKDSDKLDDEKQDHILVI